MPDKHDATLAPNFYFDSHFQSDAVKILPGEYYVTARPLLIVTVLGSCVAACIRDRVSGIGGMNHFMLPAASGDEAPLGTQGCYGIYAMKILINKLLEIGARRENLEAKLFGGGNLLKSFTVDGVGARNAAFVRNYLESEHIPIVGTDLLDNYSRKIYFFPDQDKVMVKKLIRLHNTTILQREREHNNRLHNEMMENKGFA